MRESRESREVSPGKRNLTSSSSSVETSPVAGKRTLSDGLVGAGGSSAAATAQDLGPGQSLDGATGYRMAVLFGHSFGQPLGIGPVKGTWEGKVIAHKSVFVPRAPSMNKPVTARRTLGSPQQTEAAALALVQTNGKAGAVTL